MHMTNRHGTPCTNITLILRIFQLKYWLDLAVEFDAIHFIVDALSNRISLMHLEF